MDVANSAYDKKYTNVERNHGFAIKRLGQSIFPPLRREVLGITNTHDVNKIIMKEGVEESQECAEGN